MKGNTVFKRSYNQCLRQLAGHPIGAALPSESEFSQLLDVSRTTVRAVLASLAKAGIASGGVGGRVLQRHPLATDYFPDMQTLSAGAAVERRFMEWILQGDFRAGQLLNAAELARQFGTSTTTIREHLAQFQHFGLLERRPNSAWLYKGVTPDFAAEIYDVREMFELRATRNFIELANDSPPWRELDVIEAEHRALLANIDTEYQSFPQLDERLHRLIHETSGNRFIIDFYDIVSTFFHYTYRWNRSDEKQRNTIALLEHLDYIEALRSRDQRAIDARCRKHLRTARATLARSIAFGPFRVPSSPVGVSS
ncbi:GntR family transcriptional regulator [Ancylobacter defluvii]|uniref:GntR family transcriptional regulator n=1 Tax=Ancylobacter defluvii TaxID=1282440 RepID=A0A9W6JW49_9HYPH|nr:GntR family transcriptional regulator [Ancylobacter defluvii]MBS7585881.1 GntR family transcriptional regulator [Ancylobacter defluvii]GLK84257.1 GntR family transcriptional regulator [Ancylobacter defluvii]